jgi:hypothetical protein
MKYTLYNETTTKEYNVNNEITIPQMRAKMNLAALATAAISVMLFKAANKNIVAPPTRPVA